jgi:alanine racemase
MSRPAKIIIDLAAIGANCRLAQSLAPHSKIVAVVKADAYGHGSAEVAKALEPQVELLVIINANSLCIVVCNWINCLTSHLQYL